MTPCVVRVDWSHQGNQAQGNKQMTALTVFRDYDRFIIAPKAQTSLSMTTGLFEAYSAKEAAALLNDARAMSDEDVTSNLRTFWTDGRFEAACDAGSFGAEW